MYYTVVHMNAMRCGCVSRVYCVIAAYVICRGISKTLVTWVEVIGKGVKRKSTTGHLGICCGQVLTTGLFRLPNLLFYYTDHRNSQWSVTSGQWSVVSDQ